MSRLFFAVGIDPDHPTVRRAIERIRRPLGPEAEMTVVAGAGWTGAVARYRWQLRPAFSGPDLVVPGSPLVLADASILYESDLVSALGDHAPPAPDRTPGRLIQSAVRTWGVDAVDRLEGEFAFASWDEDRRRLLVARDLVGRRPLYWARLPAEGIAVSSSPRALAELEGVSAEPNLPYLASRALGLAWAQGSESAYQGVDVVPAAQVISWSERGGVVERRFWDPPAVPDPDSITFNEAAEELRVLLKRAVAERLTPGVTTVWMSGGWDSSSVFAAGRDFLRECGAESQRIVPVSISYPEGDPGREDELIREVTGHWGAEANWLDQADIELLVDLPERCALAEEPPAHLYEDWNRALARSTRAAGSRVALDGCGGDQLFAVSNVVLADQIRRGQWLKAVRRLRATRQEGWRRHVRFGLIPLFSRGAIRGLESLLGRSLPRHYLERGLSPWASPDYVREHRLRERDLDILSSTGAGTAAQGESVHFVLGPIWGWGASYMQGPLLQEGVVGRSPLLDGRIIDFALRRPIEERAAVGETKRLLRASMKGLLPDSFLAPRSHRTGATVAFSSRHMRRVYPDLFRRLFSEPLELARAGAVNENSLREAVRRWEEGEETYRVDLAHLMKVEFWLRGRRNELLPTTPAPRTVEQRTSAA
jgi:asparagine synthase (glutamine-hydrolysing)